MTDEEFGVYASEQLDAINEQHVSYKKMVAHIVGQMERAFRLDRRVDEDTIRRLKTIHMALLDEMRSRR